MTRETWAVALVLSCGVAEAAAPPARRGHSAGDELPPGAFVRLGSKRWYHEGGPSHGVSFTAAGEPMSASGSWVYVWDVASGKARQRFPAPKANYGTPQTSKDGKLLFLGGESGSALYEAATGKRIDPPDAPWARNWATLSPDGHVVAVREPGGVRLVESKTGREIRKLKGHPGGSARVVFSPDGSWLAAPARAAPKEKTCEVTVWDAASGRAFWIPFPGQYVTWLAFSPDSNLLALAGDSSKVYVWEVLKGVHVQRLDGGRESSGFAFSPDGKSLAVLRKGEVSFHSVQTGEVERSLDLSPGPDGAISFSPCGKYLAATESASQRIALFDARTGRRVDDREGVIVCFAVSPDGSAIATVDAANNFALWDALTGEPRRHLFRLKEDVRVDHLRFGDGGKMLAWSQTPRRESRFVVRACEVPSGKATRCRVEVGSGLKDLDFSEHAAVLAAQVNKRQPLLFDARTGERHGELPGIHKAEWWDVVRLTADGKSLLAATSPQQGEPEHDFVTVVQFWDVSTTRRPKTWKLKGRDLGACAFRQCDQTVFAIGGHSEREGLRCWDTRRNDLSRVIPFTDDTFHDLHGRNGTVVSPDGKLVLTRGDSFKEADLHAWESATGRLVASFNLDGRPIGSPRRLFFGEISTLRLSPNGRRMYAQVTGGFVVGWDLLEIIGGDELSKPLNGEEISRQWELLSGEDAAAALDAVARLARSPEYVVPFVRKHLRPAPLRDVKRIREAIANLDDDDFDVRSAAFARLERLGLTAEFELDEAARSEQTAEVRLRVAQLLEKLEALPRVQYERRHSRAVQLLSWIASREARVALQELSEGDPAAPLTSDAKHALRVIGDRAKNDRRD